MKSLYSTHSVLKRLCKFIYIISIGDFWYEPTYRPKWKTFMYSIYSMGSKFLFYAVIFLEFLEFVMDSFPEDQHRDATSYAMAQIVVFIRIYLFNRNKDEVKALMMGLIKVCSEFEEESLLKLQRRKINTAMGIQFCAVYAALCLYNLDALRRMYYQGILKMILQLIKIISLNNIQSRKSL